MPIELSVVVCTYNRSSLLPYCLQSLVDQTLDKELYEVLIINNNSSDDTQSIIDGFSRKASNFRALSEPIQGLSHARNRGWKESKGKFIAYIDDDAKAIPEWCEKILDAFKTVTPEPVAVGGEIRPFYEKDPPSWFTDDYEVMTWGKEAGFLQLPRAPNGFAGSNMAFKRLILEEYGGFSSNYGMRGNKIGLGEETELFMRVYKDYPLFWYDPGAKIFHWVPIRNMRITYRLKRAYKSGEATAYIYNRRVLTKQYLSQCMKFCLVLGSIPLRLLRPKKNFKSECAKILTEIVAGSAYLSISLIKIPKL